MRVLRYWRLGLGAAVALSVGLAFADPVPAVTYPECNRKPTPADVEGAKGAHKAANQFYDRGDYDKAIRYWNDAYGFDCTAHSVLINIANAYEKKGDKPAAIATLETYVRRSGPDPTIEEKVKNLKQSLQTMPPSTTGVIPTATVSSSAVPTASVTSIPTAPPPIVQRPYGLAPWVVVGVGGAAVVVGAILLPLGLTSIREAERHCPERQCTQANVEYFRSGNDGRVRAGIGIAGLSIGGVAMASGLVWQLMFNRPREVGTVPPLSLKSIGPGGVQFTPRLGPGQAGLTVSGGF